MRKLRNFSFAEAVEWADKDYNRGYRLQLLAKTLLGESTGYSVPDSFYEQPPKGSFGQFDGGIWGHLEELRVIYDNRPWYRCRENGNLASIFTPGLPQDVDADGMPK